jgi:hypothetical protein
MSSGNRFDQAKAILAHVEFQSYAFRIFCALCPEFTFEISDFESGDQCTKFLGPVLGFISTSAQRLAIQWRVVDLEDTPQDLGRDLALLVLR